MIWHLQLLMYGTYLAAVQTVGLGKSLQQIHFLIEKHFCLRFDIVFKARSISLGRILVWWLSNIIKFLENRAFLFLQYQCPKGKTIMLYSLVLGLWTLVKKYNTTKNNKKEFVIKNPLKVHSQ